MPLLKESGQIPPLTFTMTEHHFKSIKELLIPLTPVAKVTQNGPTLFELAEEILKKAKTTPSCYSQIPTFFNDTLSRLSAHNDAVARSS
jgi:hypothetical protein